MKKYFFAIKEAQFGPVSLDEILTKDLDKDTLVWHEGLPDWVRLSEIPELNVKMDASLPPPISVKGNGFRDKNSLKIFSAIAFIVVTLITSGLFIYPKWENEKKYEEALSFYMKTDSIQFEVFNELAIKDHTKSNFILGIYYYDLGDSIKAKESLEEAISHGYEVTGLYLLYWTNPKDSSKYEERIEENFASWVNDISDSDWLAQLFAGRIYEFGIGVKRNPRKAIEFYEMASKNGSVQADFLLGVMYNNVEEVKDYEKSLSFLKKSYELGYYPAVSQIGKLYEDQKNYDQSIYWFTKGAKKNEIFSEYRLGYFYSKGLGVSENLDSAKYWYERALENKKPQKVSAQFIEEIKGFSKEFLDQVIIFDQEEKKTANNQVFNCLTEDLESRGMTFEFESDKIKVLYKKSGNHFIFYEDGKWEAFEKAQNKVHLGTWECDGEYNYKIFTNQAIYNSRENQWWNR
jgi:TPR repeat protein